MPLIIQFNASSRINIFAIKRIVLFIKQVSELIELTSETGEFLGL